MPLKMKKSVVFRRCESFIAVLIDLYPNGVISLADLKYLIRRNLGAHPTTVANYLRELTEDGFITPIGPSRYRINALMAMKAEVQKTLDDHEAKILSQKK